NHDWSMRTRIPPMEKALNADTEPPSVELQGSGHSLTDQLTQHVLQNAAVTVVLDFVWCIDAHGNLECLFLSVVAPHANRHKHAGLDAAGDPVDIKCFVARETQTRGAVSFSELQRQDAHADEVASM